MNKRRLAIIIFMTMSVLYFFSILHRVGVAVIASDIMKEFNTDASLLGLMSSSYFFPYAIAQIPVGVMLDRVGIRRTVTILSSVACLGALVFSLGPSIFLISIGRALVGFGVGGFYVSALKAVAVWFPPGRFATLAGTLTSIGNIGGIVATSPLALLTLMMGWRGAFLVIFFFMLLFTGVAWFIVRDNDSECYSRSSVSSDLMKIFRNRDFLKIMMIPFFAYGFFIAFQGLWGGPFLMDIYRMDKAAAGFQLMFIGFGFTISGPLSGFLSDRVVKGRKPILLAGLIMSVIFWFIMAAAGSALYPLSISALFFVLGFSFGFVNIYMTMSKELFTPDIYGMAMASFNTFNFIGAGFFQFFMGYLLDVTYGGLRPFAAYQLIFTMCTVGIVIAAMLCLVSRETIGRPPSTACRT